MGLRALNNTDSSFEDVFSGTGGLDGAEITITGGTKTQSGGKTIHTFTSPGNFVSSADIDVHYLLIGGGAGGGGASGGGGGAGQFREDPTHPLTAGTYPVTIGSGGIGGKGYPVEPTSPTAPGNGYGVDGGNTVTPFATAYGGGGGGFVGNGAGGTPNNYAKNGVNYPSPTAGSGSGGGQMGQGAPAPEQVVADGGPVPLGAYPGGLGGGDWPGGGDCGSVHLAGGGGGAGGAGFNSNCGVPKAGDGGSGKASDISGLSVTYAGGGGGAGGWAKPPNLPTPTVTWAAGSGGSGGGGAGGRSTIPSSGPSTSANGSDATGYGSGGGGGTYTNGGTGGQGGDGSDGIVIISYTSV